MGIEYLLEGYDFNPMFEKIPLNESPHRSIRIPINVHIVIELDYVGSGEDFELFTEVLGFLDDKMQLSRVIV